MDVICARVYKKIIFDQFPSCPKSSANLNNFVKSSSFTVFFWFCKDFNIILKSTGGSSNVSPSTSIQVFSTAPGSPGPHGVHKSYRYFSESFGSLPSVWKFKPFVYKNQVNSLMCKLVSKIPKSRLHFNL